VTNKQSSAIRMGRRMGLLGLIASMMAGDIKSKKGLPITTWTQFSTLFLVNFPDAAPEDLSGMAIKETIISILEDLIANVKKSETDVAAGAGKILTDIPRKRKQCKK